MCNATWGEMYLAGNLQLSCPVPCLHVGYAAWPSQCGGTQNCTSCVWPPPPQTFECIGGLCTAAATGASKADCESVCVAETFECIDGQCIESAIGASKAVCESMCVAETFECIGNRCKESATGVSKAVCESVCKGTQGDSRLRGVPIITQH